MLFVLALATALPGAPATEALDFTVTAELGNQELEPGGSYEIAVHLSFPDGVIATAAGVPAPILQLDVPTGVTLPGKHLSTAQELASNNHLRAPYERLVYRGDSKIAFELADAPDPAARLGLNFVAYLSADGGERQRFVRRRLELPLEPGATAEVVEGTSDWGPDEHLLQIGDRVPLGVQLWDSPDENKLVGLEHAVGDSWSVILTYRAHW